MSSRARKKRSEINGNSLGVVLSPGGLAGAERSEGERSEPQRSAYVEHEGSIEGASPLQSLLEATVSQRQLRVKCEGMFP